MFKKFLEIKGIGRFLNYSPTGDIELRKFNIIYGHNGSGKTTFSDILNSLANKDSSIVQNKRSFSFTDHQKAVLIFDNNGVRTNIKYENDQRDTDYSDVYVFNTHFIDSHVISGYVISSDHKKKLYNFMADQNLSNNTRALEQKKQEIVECQADINQKKNLLEGMIQGVGIDIDTFISLPDDPQIDKKIEEISLQIINMKRIDSIKQQKLSPIPYFKIDFESDIEEICNKEIGGVNYDDIELVRKHVDQYHPQHINWLEAGSSYEGQEFCPYCAQDVSSIKLTSAYKSYFNKEYRELSVSIEKNKKKIESISDNDFLRIINANNAILVTLKSYEVVDNGEAFTVDLSQLHVLFNQVKITLNAFLDQKGHNILDKVTYSHPTEIDQINEVINIYNQHIERINQISSNYITSLPSGPSDLESKKKYFELRKKRYEQSYDEVCKLYKGFLEKKLSLNEEKDRIKDALDTMISATFSQYGTAINSILGNFSASYNLENIGGGIIGSSREVSLKFDLKFGSSAGEASNFSDGDRTTFAFALFCAKLRSDANLSNKIVIIDDPFSSLDRNRLQATVEQIEWIAQNSKQLIILTHSTLFLSCVTKIYTEEPKKFLTIQGSAEFESQIVETDIDSLLLDSYFTDIKTITGFLSDISSINSQSDLKGIAKCIRPILERYLIIKYPTRFAFESGRWLGDFIGHIRDSEDPVFIYFKTNCLLELEAINNYSKQFHHDRRTGVDDPSIEKSELLTYLNRTINLIAR